MKKLSPALFLDRDGVINKNLGYVSEISDFEFFPEIIEICGIAQKAGLPIVVVTNQSGIGRGYFSEEDFEFLTNWMIAEFNKSEIRISLVLYAPENPEDKTSVSGPTRRKPSPAMFFEAGRMLQLDLTNSIMIGDNETDMIAAERAGIENRILIGGMAANSVATVTVVNHKYCVSAVGTIILQG